MASNDPDSPLVRVRVALLGGRARRRGGLEGWMYWPPTAGSCWFLHVGPGSVLESDRVVRALGDGSGGPLYVETQRTRYRVERLDDAVSP